MPRASDALTTASTAIGGAAAATLLDGGVRAFAHGHALLLCDDHATQRLLAERPAAEGWSTRELEESVRLGKLVAPVATASGIAPADAPSGICS